MDFPSFRVIGVETTDNTICVTVEGDGDRKPCPRCGHESAQEHSRYPRCPRDLPIQGRPIRLRAIIRRFRCTNQGCSKKTFAESLGVIAARYAHRTNRLTETLESLILELSSAAGARLAARLGIQTSPRTLLRVVGGEVKDVAAPRVLGVDDFALRRGHTYGTLLCDLETGRPIDVLLGRKAEPLIEWLKRHPGIEVIARDRASAYADAARLGAPDAVQVADRFHLVKNVGDALREVVDQKSWALPNPPQQSAADQVELVLPTSKSNSKPASAQQRKHAATTERRRLLHAEVVRRRTNGESMGAIAEATGASLSTVKRFCRMPEGPQPITRRRQFRNTDPFLAYLQQRWQDGSRNGKRLYAELVAQGYTGSPQSVRRTLTEWRRADPPCPAAASTKSRPTTPKAPQWKELRWYILGPAEYLRPEHTEPLTAMLALHPELDEAYKLTQWFRRILKEKLADDLDPWLVAAADSGLSPFQRLARTLRADRAAVKAGIELQWSTGPVEGQITRLKLLKRIGYGRAGLHLLRARLIGVA